MGTVDAYLQSLDGPARAAYARIAGLVLAEVPDVEQGTSYGMAAFIYRGKPLLAFKAARDHLSVFPFSSRAVQAVQAELAGFSLSKGTIRFTADRPPPDQVLRGLLRARLAEIDSAGPKRGR